MKLNPSVVDKVVYFCTNYGGHKDEARLQKHLQEMRLSPYMDSNGNISLVDSLSLVKELMSRNRPTSNVVPMRLHGSTIAKILQEYQINSGHTNEAKLRRSFAALDLTPYDKKTSVDETILVLTEDYIKVMSGTKE